MSIEAPTDAKHTMYSDILLYFLQTFWSHVLFFVTKKTPQKCNACNIM